MIKMLMVWSLTILSFPALANEPVLRTCSDLVLELHAMQAAQSSLLKSFVSKNETMAESFDQVATELKVRKQKKESIKNRDIAALSKSAEAFRGHGEREAKLVQRFEKASQDLVRQVEICLTPAVKSASN
ncbi:MAG: hypothetical protein ACK5P6_08065 [Pseudobdellovibrionaceae bacterium]